MLSINYEKYVEALWDSELKEKLHEMFYDLLPELGNILSIHLLRIQSIKDISIKIKTTIIETMARYIIDVQDPDPCELDAFIRENAHLLMRRIDDIMDKEEIEVQIKRRRLLR